MSILVLLLIMLSVILSVGAQILLKYGMSSTAITEAISRGPIETAIAVLTDIAVLGGLVAYVASAAVWLAVLSKLEVSKAYPFVGLGFVLTMLFAYFFLSEPITALKAAGTLLVVIGVVMISMS